MDFHWLTVSSLRKTIRDAVVVTLEPDEPSAFAFVPGQYLTFRRDFDGVELRRSYSLCTPPNGTLQVGIKRVEGGAFSTWANTQLKVGDRIEALPPMGQFFAPPDGDHVLCFAGGSGITPILSILRAGLASSHQRFTLVYANRAANTVMFREELSDLKDRYLGRLNVIHVLEDDSAEIDLFRGRVDEEKCASLFDRWIDLQTVAQAYICGPQPMMEAIRDSLARHGIAPGAIRIELFKSAQPGRAKHPAAAVKTTTGIPARVTLGGESRSFSMSSDTCLLDAAINNSLDAPFACRAGVCSTCKAKVLEGEVEMLANHALEDDEVRDGFVLTCQCYPLSDRVVWDYDQAGH